MKICGISDMHGNLGFSIDKCDVLCIAGDVVPLSVQRNENGTMKWIDKTFIPWCNAQPADKVILIAGNHDFTPQWDEERYRKAFEGTKITYLKDESVIYDGVKFYGTPWCHVFYDWAFMVPDNELAEIFGKIPDDVDVLITHDSPYGASDVLMQFGYYTGNHIGSEPLAKAVGDKKPKHMLHGHLHSTNHGVENIGDTKVYCVSVLDERYNLAYEPLYIEI